MSFMMEVPSDSGVDLLSGDGGEATAVAPSLLGKCIFDAVAVERGFTDAAIMKRRFFFSSFSTQFRDPFFLLPSILNL